MIILNSLIVTKNVEGGALGFFNIPSVARYRKKNERGSFGDKKFFEKKVAQCRKKSEGGTLCTKFALAPLPDWAP